MWTVSDILAPQKVHKRIYWRVKILIQKIIYHIYIIFHNNNNQVLVSIFFIFGIGKLLILNKIRNFLKRKKEKKKKKKTSIKEIYKSIYINR